MGLTVSFYLFINVIENFARAFYIVVSSYVYLFIYIYILIYGSLV